MNILRNILVGIIGFALVIILPLVIFTFVTAKSPVLFDFRSFVVLTGSMEPVLPVGSMVYTQPKPSYAVGEMITFKDAEDRTVTHRIIDVKDDKFITKGDANNAPDRNPIPKDRVIGSVFFNVPHIGKYNDFLKRPQNFILFIVLPSLIFVGFELWNIKNEIVKETEKRVLKRLEVDKS